MKVILVDRVPHLGNVGEIVNVSNGFFRNFLAPNKLAVFADESSQKQVEIQKRRLGKKVQEQKNAALAIKGKLDGVVLEFVKKVGANGKLFGVVTSSEISKELEGKGLTVERRLLIINNPVKSVGTFEIKAKLFAEVEAKFQVKVVMDPAQAEELKARSKAGKKAKKDDVAADATAAKDAAPERELTEDEKLAAEANKILRG